MRPYWLLPLGLFLSSCSASSDDTKDDSSGLDLSGRTFYSESAVGHTLLVDIEIRLTFERSKLTTFAGCNARSADYHFERHQLVVQFADGIDMSCQSYLIGQEAWFNVFLAMSPTAELVEPRLTLSSGSQILTLVEGEYPIPDRPLVETSWVGSGVDEGTGVIAVPSSSNLSVWFGSDGRFEGFSGCQRLSGSFAATASAISFSELVPDGAPCSDPALDGFSQLFLSVLDGSEVSFDIEGTDLTLERAGKALYFTAAPPRR